MLNLLSRDGMETNPQTTLASQKVMYPIILFRDTGDVLTSAIDEV